METETIQQQGWTREDTLAARQIMQTPVWAKMMEIAIAERPKIKAKTREDRCDEAIEAQTWERCLSIFNQFAAGLYEQNEETIDQPDMSIPRPR